MKQKYPLKVGLFGIGLEAYWSQFEGLKARLEGFIEIVAQKINAFDTEVVNLGLVDTPEKPLKRDINLGKQMLILSSCTSRLMLFPPPFCQWFKEQKFPS